MWQPFRCVYQHWAQINVERIQVSATISNSIFLLSWELIQTRVSFPTRPNGKKETGTELWLLELQPFCELSLRLTGWPVPLSLCICRHFSQEESNKANSHRDDKISTLQRSLRCPKVHRHLWEAPRRASHMSPLAQWGTKVLTPRGAF